MTHIEREYKDLKGTISDLSALVNLQGLSYYFVVKTYTPAHGNQQNDLTSAMSEEVSAGAPGPRGISTSTE